MKLNEAENVPLPLHSDLSVKLWLGTVIAGFIWSGIQPADWFAWVIHMIPVLAFLGLILLTYRYFPLTRMTYVLILFYLIILMISAHFASYQVMIWDYLQKIFKIGTVKKDVFLHIIHGAVPAIIVREILIRKEIVSGNGRLMTATLSVCLSISALHHVFDWWVALLVETLNDNLMLAYQVTRYAVPNISLTLCGAIMAILLLEKQHDMEIELLRYAN